MSFFNKLCLLVCPCQRLCVIVDLCFGACVYVCITLYVRAWAHVCECVKREREKERLWCPKILEMILSLRMYSVSWRDAGEDGLKVCRVSASDRPRAPFYSVTELQPHLSIIVTVVGPIHMTFFPIVFRAPYYQNTFMQPLGSKVTACVGRRTL